MEATRAVRDAVGARYPVLAKINCRDFVENGLTLEDSLEVSMMLKKAGIDAIELSGGLLNLPNLMKESIDSEEDEAGFKNEAKVFKERISVPLLLVGGIRSLSVAEKLIEKGYADYISMCRPFIREPNLINRWKSGDRRKATCISCNNCIQEARSGEGVRCVPKKEEPSETFFPEISETVPASPPLPPGTAYRISIGIEDWNSSFLPVVKIETVIDGEVTNRSTSFPLGSKDNETVAKAITELLKKHNAIHSKD
jgi:tRNA-dihydrouridine synthase